jgi:hypothetical protein
LNINGVYRGLSRKSITWSALPKEVKVRQEDARQHDEWEEALRESLAGVQGITLTDVAQRLHIPIEYFDKSVQTRLQ